MQYAKLTTSLLFMLCFFAMPQFAAATVYYVAFDQTTGTFAGTSVANAFSSLDAFTEAARTAGDIAIVKRGVASTTNTSDLDFTSDGTIANPLIITADYDNVFGNFATSSETWNVAPGNSYIASSASTTSAFPGKWVYFMGDCTENAATVVLNQCEFAYEVQIASSTGILLYMPYRGNQTSATAEMRVLPSNPQWNVASGDFQWNFDTDDYWLIKGLDIRGTDANGNIEIDSSIGHQFSDTIFNSNGANDAGITTTDDSFSFAVNKSRFFNYQRGIHLDNGVDIYGQFVVSNSLFDGNAVANSQGVSGLGLSVGLANGFISNSFLQNNALRDVSALGVGGNNYLRANVFRSATEVQNITTLLATSLFFEDYDGVVGDNNFRSIGAGANANTSLLQSTSTLRSGGGPTSIQVNPTTNTSRTWEFNKIKLFDYPVYTNTSAKQYDVYFKTSTTTAEWTADPIPSELWIECDYWVHGTGATSTRKVTKSTGTIDFNGSSDWQSLSVTCQPTQTGILYLRGWYAKTKESGQTNEFLIDNTPVIN